MSASEIDPQIEAESRHLSYPGLILPVTSAILGTTLVFFFAGAEAALELVTTAVATATVAGKFIVVRGLADGGFFDSPSKLAILVVYLDLMVALIAVYNIGIFFKIPRFGTKIERLQKNGVRILERNPWMSKVTFLGIIAFVMFPLSGTGAIGGSVFGRLLGLSRAKTLLGIAIGSVMGAFFMAFLAETFGESLVDFQENPVSTIGGILALALAAWWILRFAKRAMGNEEDSDAKSDERFDKAP